MISALATFAVFAATRSPVQIESRSFDLPPAKAAAMFRLLKPKDVKVIVARDGNHVQIKGTHRECDALTDFIGLIGRFSSQSECQVRRQMERARKTWTTHETYRLPKSKAKALFDALAPDDVPVLVSWSGKRLRIDASPTDQAILKQLVQILRGRRL